jgi:hypothetical protein
MNEFALLLCGARSEGTAKIALDQLASSIRIFSARAARFLAEDITDEALNFGPFCARVLLENGCAALVGRLDAFRMLYLSEFQAQPEYEPGKRARSAFAWSGDVMPADEKSQQALWNLDHDLSKISRALFSKHVDHIFWKPALNRMLDYVSNLETDPLLSGCAQYGPGSFHWRSQGAKRATLFDLVKKCALGVFHKRAVV